jgi:predicted TPR repeat methyltransferase
MRPKTLPITRNPRLAALFEKAQGMQRQRRFGEAEALYALILKQWPGEPNTLHYLGVLRSQQGRHREALNLVAQALQQLPGDAGVWNNFANVLIEAGEFDDAQQALRRVRELDPDSPRPDNNLGVLQMRLGQLEEAEQALLRALERDPGADFVHINLSRLYSRTRRYREATVHALRSVDLDAKNPRARKLLSLALELEGRHEEAVQVVRDWAACLPDDAEARHYLAAFGAADVPERASDDYVKTVFDRFAASFDRNLEQLGYQAPGQVCAALERQRPLPGPAAVVLDAGCGTGLCGPLLRPWARRLEGVDLSPGMLRQAEARRIYDALTEAELTAFLLGHAGCFDAVACADVLNYFGELGPVFRAAAMALRPGGLLAFSVEAAGDGVERYALATHGRYAHARGEVERLLVDSGLQLREVSEQVLRSELGVPVRGWVYAVARP